MSFDREQLRRRLMATFVGELAEHVAALDRDLGAAETATTAEARAEAVRGLFRTVHSLKGAARAVDLLPIATLCHDLEDRLAAARDAGGALAPGLASLLSRAITALDDASRRLGTSGAVDAAALAAVRADDPAAAPTPSSEPAPAPVPAPAPPPAAAPPLAVAPAATRAPDRWESLRISTEKIDRLLAHGGELGVVRRRTAMRADQAAALQARIDQLDAELRAIGQAAPLDAAARDGASPREPPLTAGARDQLRAVRRDLDRLAVALADDARALERAAGPLERELQRVRMLPFRDACEGLERHARELARASDKVVELRIEGDAVESDRAILQALRDPLLHLVRNAIDHGVEPPAAREAAGKPRVATLTVRAGVRGDRLEVEVRDDGRGLDLVAIAARRRGAGLPVPADAAELARTIFEPGVSTVEAPTEVSGRGVGLDVVKTRIEALHGTVEVSSEPGQGTRFVLAMPLSLTSIRVLLVRCAGQVLAIPTVGVAGLVRAGAAELTTLAGRDVLRSSRGPIPAMALAEVVGFATASGVRGAGKLPLIVTAGEPPCALAVDELLDEYETVLKPLPARLRGVAGLAGAILLADGAVGFVLNVAAVVRGARARAAGSGLVAAVGASAGVRRKRVLVVDDSLTTRTLEATILEASGYEIETAPNGEAAWELLQQRGADLVVSDIEMPRMDGFQLVEAIRHSDRFRALPVVLVTALESERDRTRGLALGASAYLPKSAFDQQRLLEVVGQLVGGGEP